MDALTAAFTSCALVPSTGRELITMRGSESIDLLNRISTNALGSMAPGQVRTTLFTTEKGKAVDLVHVLPRSDGADILTSPGAGEAVRLWISRFVIMEDVLVETPGAQYTVAALAGPHALATTRDFRGIDLRPEQATEVGTPGGTTMLLALTEFGTDWVYMISPGTGLQPEARVNPSIPALNPASYDILRILRGMPMFGKEIREQFNPYDLGLTFAVSCTKGCYVGQEVIARLDTYDKAQRHLLGLHFRDAHPQGAEGMVLRLDGAEVGVVTSVAALGGQGLGLGVLKKEVGPGSELTLTHAGGASACRTFSVPIAADQLGSFDIQESR